jgi:hypothetical protein
MSGRASGPARRRGSRAGGSRTAGGQVSACGSTSSSDAHVGLSPIGGRRAQESTNRRCDVDGARRADEHLGERSRSLMRSRRAGPVTSPASSWRMPSAIARPQRSRAGFVCARTRARERCVSTVGSRAAARSAQLALQESIHVVTAGEPQERGAGDPTSAAARVRARPCGRCAPRDRRAARRGRTRAPRHESPGMARPASASMTTASSTSGKSCPLATICVPTRIAAPGAANASRISLTAPRVRTASASRRCTRVVGQRSASSELDALGPGTHPGDVGRAALGALLGHGLVVAAVVTCQSLAARDVAVDHERHVAAIAAERVSTAPAVQRDRVAAAVVQDDHLAVAAAGLRRSRPARVG